ESVFEKSAHPINQSSDRREALDFLPEVLNNCSTDLIPIPSPCGAFSLRRTSQLEFFSQITHEFLTVALRDNKPKQQIPIESGALVDLRDDPRKRFVLSLGS